MELQDAADRRVKGYSGGMKRRLDLASALVNEPEVLFPSRTIRPPSMIASRGRRAGGLGMSAQTLVLGRRALIGAWRTPEALVPTLFIPLFFLVVNVGQAGKIFPSSSTAFLHGQGYGAFQLPSSLLLAASFGTAALFLVEDIEDGYFDKLRAAPVSRA
jgi:hypothetical protein